MTALASRRRIELVWPWGPKTSLRMARTLGAYSALWTTCFLVIFESANPSLRALALGLMFPGAGFLAWAGPANSSPNAALILAMLSFGAFFVAIALWAATGNIILPAIVWFIPAILAARADAIGIAAYGEPVSTPILESAPATIAALVATTLALNLTRALLATSRRGRTRAETDFHARPSPSPRDDDELSLETLQLMRVLYDRALQPIEGFEGFERRDQFQTAAIRYQINFISYALSLAAHTHLPAFAGYHATAQQNLLAKQLDPRIWAYWRFESLWGHLSTNRNPIARDNIMYSGFLAAQIAYARASSGLEDADGPRSLVFNERRGVSHASSQAEIIDLLVGQYRRAPYGLIACEPNWIYPLCNFLTASAILANDAQTGRNDWQGICGPFRDHLEKEFHHPDGRLVCFRSSHLGFAAPAIGGALMQAFPCLFLSVAFPDLAERHWDFARKLLAGRDPRRSHWPFDIGNYGWSRAASYAGSAAAAVEMGDSEFGKRLLELLDADCPRQHTVGVTHRSNASLWAHAVEIMARVGSSGALRRLVTKPHAGPPTKPYIRAAGYPDVLVAKARSSADGALHAVLYPGNGRGFKRVTFAGFAPLARYRLVLDKEYEFDASHLGEAHLNVPLSGRTSIHIRPAL